MGITDIGAQTILCPRYGIIYRATCTLNGKVYVGQTVQSLPKRRHGHKVYALLYKDETPFHRAIRKHGWDSFTWETMDMAVSKEDLDTKESYWIRVSNSLTTGQGYNAKDGGSNGKRLPEFGAYMSKVMTGRRHTEETKQKLKGKPMPAHVRAAIRKASLGRKQSQEEKDKRAASLRGKAVSDRVKELLSEAAKRRYQDPEERRKLSASLTGRAVSEATRQKLREANLGKKAPESVRVKMSSSQRGLKKKPMSESTKEKQRDAHLGKKASDATRQKIREGNLGKVMSPESRAKMVASWVIRKEQKYGST
jgi:group I intron endonuclease